MLRILLLWAFRKILILNKFGILDLGVLTYIRECVRPALCCYVVFSKMQREVLFEEVAAIADTKVSESTMETGGQ